MRDRTEHPTSDTLQLYAEGELDEREGQVVADHVTECRRCASEVDAWSLLFRELDDLPALGPSEGFRERVVSAAPRGSEGSPASVPERLRGFLERLVGGGRGRIGHLSPEGIQALLEGALGGRQRRQVQAHVAACAPCKAELESWTAVFQELASLPPLSPSPAFADRVMAGVAIPEPARGQSRAWALATELKAWARGLLPTGRKGWALAGGVVAAPAVGLAAAMVAVVAHPLLTVADLAAFLWWRTGDAATAMGGWAIQQAVEAPVPAAVYDVFGAVAGSPGLAAAGLAVIWSATVAAGWVLYKNVLSTYFVAEPHVR